MSNYFTGFLEARRGEGTGGVSPCVCSGSGPPRENFEKIKQNGAIWSAKQAFYTRSSLASSLVILQPVLGLYPSPFSGPNAYCGQK